MSKPDATGAKSLEEILASIRKSLAGAGEASDAASTPRDAAPRPAQVAPEPGALDGAAGDGDGLLSARLAGALREPVNGAALDEDISDLLAPDGENTAPPEATAAAAKPADARNEGKDPLWFLRRPSAGAESKSNGPQPPPKRAQPDEGPPPPAPRPVEEVKLSRPEVLRASLPPLFGADAEHAPAARTGPPEALKVGPGVAPTMPPPDAAPAATGETAKGAPANLLTARTQPLLPPEPPADEMAKVVVDAEAAPAPGAGERTHFRAAAPTSLAEAAPERQAASDFPQVAPDPEAVSSPQPAAEKKPANGLVNGLADPLESETHADMAAKSAPAASPEPSVAKPAAGAEPAPARTLEQVIGELLEPVIRQWLESNLPRLVERVVREEVARVIASDGGAPKV